MNNQNLERAIRLKSIVDKSGKKPRRFAMDNDIDPSQFNKMLKGDIGMSYDMARKIADNNSTTAAYIMDGIGENVPREITKTDKDDNVDILIRSNSKLVESNSILAQAVHDAVNIIKDGQKLSSDVVSQKLLSDPSMLNRVLESMSNSVVGMTWHSSDEALAALRNIFFAKVAEQFEVGTPVGDGS